MCGIAGIYNLSREFNREVLISMNECLSHRGSDSEGFFFDNIAALAHRRLSVIDLSEKAKQPMTDSSGRYVITYNGELYNYREIAESLKMPLQTDSDTEVLLNAYVKEGTECLKSFNGMFAFAIYDKEDKSLFVARDRMGIKPLYYFWNGENFIFGSELKIFQSANFKLEIDQRAVEAFFHLGYIPEPYTIYKDILKFPSGSFLKIKDTSFEMSTYWKLEECIPDRVSINLESDRSILKDLLIDSVRKRMLSDVPLGTFLSGGTDSSLITAIAQSLSEKPVQTFCIGFSDSSFNEAPYASRIATHLKTDHHEFILKEEDALNRISWMIDHFDEPFGDSSAIPMELLSEKASESVTVCLSGDGADELFHGYGSYIWAKRLYNPFLRRAGKLSSLFFNKLSNRYKRIALLLNYREKDFLPSHIFSQENYLFSSGELEGLLKQTGFAMNYSPVLSRKLKAAEFQALFDLRYYLKDDLLTKVDRTSMYNSLEVRVPFLDHRIVDFSLDLHPSMKIRHGISKYIVKSILHEYVPREYFNRPKWGFSIPLQHWLKGQLKSNVENCLSREFLEHSGFVHWEYVNDLLKEFHRGKNYLYNRIWLLYVFHKWLMNQKDVVNRTRDQLNYQHGSKLKASHQMLDL